MSNTVKVGSNNTFVNCKFKYIYQFINCVPINVRLWNAIPNWSQNKNVFNR